MSLRARLAVDSSTWLGKLVPCFASGTYGARPGAPKRRAPEKKTRQETATKANEVVKFEFIAKFVFQSFRRGSLWPAGDGSASRGDLGPLYFFFQLNLQRCCLHTHVPYFVSTHELPQFAWRRRLPWAHRPINNLYIPNLPPNGNYFHPRAGQLNR